MSCSVFSDSILAVTYNKGSLPSSSGQSQSDSVFNFDEKLITLEDILSAGSGNENCFINDTEALMMESSGTQHEINFYNRLVLIFLTYK